VLNGISGEALDVNRPILGEFSDSDFTSLSSISHDEELIKKLLRTGILTDSSHEQETEIFRSFVTNTHNNELKSPPTYSFILSYDCNFSCVYCYQQKISEHKNGGPVFSKKMVDGFFENIPEIEKNKYPPKNGIRGFSFIGGEPFLVRHKPIIKYIIDKANSLGRSAFSAVSNAYFLDRYTDLLGPECISSIQVTLDGPAHIHDKRRFTKSGKGTFAKIAENIDLAIREDVKINLRVNVDRGNLAYLPELAGEIVGHNWHKTKLFSVHIGLVHGDFIEDSQNKILNTSIIYEFIDRNKNKFPELDVFSLVELDSIKKLKNMIQSGKSVISSFKPTYCYAHNNNVIIDPQGRIYTCLETDQGDDYLIGAINSQGKLTWSEQNKKRWQNRSVANIYACMQCGFALFCGGGCVVRAVETNGDMYSPYCQDFKELFVRMFKL
jgi:uncharacterized protein